MKRGYSKLLYTQRNKNETIVSVIERLFGEHITSRLVKTQNRELSFRCIAYNIHRLTKLTISSSLLFVLLRSHYYRSMPEDYPKPQHRAENEACSKHVVAAYGTGRSIRHTRLRYQKDRSIV